jgi:hypothetical protein
MNLWQKWWLWVLCTTGIWIFPVTMMVICGLCHTPEYEEPPCGPWAAEAMNALFLLNFVPVAVCLALSWRHPVRLPLAIIALTAEVVVTFAIWLVGGASIAGSYF